jgi:hypothetical protein
LERGPGNLEAAAVARALEFLFRLKPVGRATQMGACGAEGINGVAAAVVPGANYPGVQILETIGDNVFFKV